MSNHACARGARDRRGSKGAIRRIAGAALWAEIALLAVLAAATIAPPLFGYATYGVLTGSMEPEIQTGALALVDTGVTGGQLQVGDIAAFDIGNGEVCTHRVTAVDPDAGQIRTKGDANASEDARPVPFADVFGRTVGSVPKLGSLMLAASDHKLALGAGAAALAVALAVASAPPRRRKTDPERNEKEN